MQVDIRITGPAGCGKTRLGNALAAFLKGRYDLPGEEVHVVIEATNHPRPKGIDTRPTHAWEKEHEFDVGA